MKNRRQKKIIEIIEENEIVTQEELASKLVEAGFDVTQATVSRDIRQMSLTKITTANGRQKYAVMPNAVSSVDNKHMRILKEGFLSMDDAGNILVIKTNIGMAMAVGAALDALDFSEIIGCIAGDDTIMCATKSEEKCISLIKKIDSIMK